MKKTMIRIAGFAAILTLFAFAGVGCTGGGGDEVQAPSSGAKASDNPSVGQPVGAGEEGSGISAGKTPGGGGRSKDGS